MNDAKPGEFAFCLLHVGHLGGNSLANYLNVHPGIAVIDQRPTDEKFNLADEAELAHPPYYPDYFQGKRVGFHLHLTRRLFPRHDDDGWPGGPLAERIGALMGSGLAIQCVRDPADHVVSFHNHNVTEYFIERFKESGDHDPYRIDDVDQFIEDFAVNYMRYWQIRERSVPPDAEWAVIDSSELVPEKVAATMGGLYGRLGVDADFQSPYFLEVWSRLAERYMAAIDMDLHIHDRVFQTRLAFEDNLNFMLGDYFTLAKAPGIAGHFDFPFPERPVVLLILSHLWGALPRKNRLDLVASGMLQEQFEAKILPFWINAVQRIHRQSQPHLLDGLTEARRVRLKALIGEDTGRMKAHHPKLADLWSL